MIDPVLWDAMRLLLAAVFALGLWHKLAAPRQFVSIVGDYRVLPTILAAPAAAGVIMVELAICAALVSGLASAWGALAAAGLLGIYMGVIGINLARGRTEIDCGCLGPAGPRPRISAWLLLRNLVLAGLALLVALTEPAVRERVWLDQLSVPAAVVIGFMLYFIADELIRNAPFIAGASR